MKEIIVTCAEAVPMDGQNVFIVLHVVSPFVFASVVGESEVESVLCLGGLGLELDGADNLVYAGCCDAQKASFLGFDFLGNGGVDGVNDFGHNKYLPLIYLGF